MQITRNQRMREVGACDVPLTFEDDVFVFDFFDCVCEIKYSKELFETFPRVKLMHEGCLVKGYTIPFRLLKQTLYRPHVMVW